jgi:hypothetical protein
LFHSAESTPQRVERVAIASHDPFSFRHFLLESWAVGRKSVITVGRFNQEKPQPVPCVQSGDHFLGQDYPSQLPNFRILISITIRLRCYSTSLLVILYPVRPQPVHQRTGVFDIDWKKLEKRVGLFFFNNPSCRMLGVVAGSSDHLENPSNSAPTDS